MIEDELRAAFTRHEELTPDPIGVRENINSGIQHRRRQRRVGQLIGAAVLVIVVAAVPGAIRMFGTGSSPQPGDGSAAPPSAAADRALNLLVLGIDRRPGSGEPSRADTVMIAHLPKSHDQGYLVSFPRDTFVDIPGHGQGKINTAYSYGGSELAASVVENLTGVKLDGTITVDFAGLVKVTDAVGGVEMCLKAKVPSHHSGRVYPVGCQHFTGEQALDLVRQRMYLPNGELDRIDNTQEYLRALFARLADAKLLTNPARMLEISAAAGNTLSLDLDPAGLLSLVGRVSPRDLVGITVPVTPADGPGEASGYKFANPPAADLFTALWKDQLDTWVTAHPEAARRR